MCVQYASKTDACKAMPKTRYYYSDKDCLTSTRVFFNDYDLDCDLVIVCEYFDGTVTTTTTTTPGTPPVAPAPTVVAPPSPSLLPKPGDSVVLSVYAIGAVQYTCNRGEERVVLFNPECMLWRDFFCSSEPQSRGFTVCICMVLCKYARFLKVLEGHMQATLVLLKLAS